MKIDLIGRKKKDISREPGKATKSYPPLGKKARATLENCSRIAREIKSKKK